MAQQRRNLIEGMAILNEPIGCHRAVDVTSIVDVPLLGIEACDIEDSVSAPW